MRRMRSSDELPEGLDESLADANEFNIDYIIRQIQPMRDGPSADELLVVLRTCDVAPCPGRFAHLCQCGVWSYALSAPGDQW